MTEPNSSHHRLGEWRKFAGLTGIQVDRRSGLERRSCAERRQPDLPTVWMRPERRCSGNRRTGDERRIEGEQRSGEDRRHV
jgi:hypothetical protein